MLDALFTLHTVYTNALKNFLLSITTFQAQLILNTKIKLKLSSQEFSVLLAKTLKYLHALEKKMAFYLPNFSVYLFLTT